MIQYISKLLYVLTDSKGKLVFIFLIFIATSVLEALGIGLIGPFINFAANPESIHQVFLLDWAYQRLPLQSSKEFIPVLGLVVAIIFCLKTLCYFLANLYIYQFSFRQKSLLRSRLLNAYLYLPYTFHLNKNTSSIIKNIILETQKFCIQSLLPLLEASANAVLIIILLVVLTRTDALLLVMISLVFLPTFLLFYGLRKKIASWGANLSQAEQGMIKVINHGLGGLKETRVIGCEAYFEQEMVWQSQKFEKAAVLYKLSQKTPRIIIETLLLLFVLFFISISQIFFKQNIQDLTASLAVFSVAAIRLIPATGKIINAFGSIQNSNYALDMLYLDLQEIANQDYISSKNNQYLHNIVFSDKIIIDNISYYYPGTTTPAIEQISFTINKGQSIGLIGKSGAGKTTLVDVILGLLQSKNGEILVDGISIYQNIRSWQNIVGYIPQSIFIIDDSIKSNIAFGVPESLIDLEKLSQVIKATQLEELVEHLPEGINTKIGERGVRLSGGQRQRVGIARALYHEREILVLDEATAALDQETEHLVSNAINSLAGRKTLIIIAHRLSTVKNCDCLYLLDKGRIVKSGSYEEVVV